MPISVLNLGEGTRIRIGVGSPTSTRVLFWNSNECGKAKMTPIRNVSYVPGLRYSLISCVELGRKGLRTTLENEERCEIINRETGDVIAVAESSENGLFKLRCAENSKISNVTASTDGAFLLWPKRLGHLSSGGMARLLDLAT
ncbi:unnamed protein product [Nezara viridula]|uniref:GAG-pre-integrase domain-containing protein n=1 Tax=Nezara viridula TaxID=85310 RepID=A0A9P0EI27_NEZVI|nr:unnamed protein product [Nezara viridula]